MGDFLTIALNAKHKKSDFACGESYLDEYLQKYASQDQKRKEAAVFVLTDAERVVIGYYTLSAIHIPLEEFSAGQLKKLRLSPYQKKPATLLGRLAVHQGSKNMRLGELLLIDALKRSYYQSEQVGSMAVVVDALHEQAARFYLTYGFVAFPDNPLRLFLPMKIIGQLFV